MDTNIFNESYSNELDDYVQSETSMHEHIYDKCECGKEITVTACPSSDLEIDTPSPPPLSCVGTANIYNVDIGISMWEKSSEEHSLNTVSPENVCKDNETVCLTAGSPESLSKYNESVFLNTECHGTLCTGNKSGCSEQVKNEMLPSNNDIMSKQHLDVIPGSDIYFNVVFENTYDKTFGPDLSICDNDAYKSCDDDFGDFERNSFTSNAYLDDYTEIECESSTSNQNITDIEIPTSYSNNDYEDYFTKSKGDNDDAFGEFTKSQDKCDNDFGEFAKCKNNSDNSIAFDNSKGDASDYFNESTKRKDKSNDDIEFATFSTVDNVQVNLDVSEGENSQQFSSIDNKSIANSELHSNHIPLIAKTDDTTFTNEALDKFDSLISRWLGNATKMETNSEITLLYDYVEEDAFIWHHLVDVESSLALKLNWNNLSSKKQFLNSLDVDARNILDKNKWNVSIPIFAQTLSFSPLTPARFKEKNEINWNTNEKQKIHEEVVKHEPKAEGNIPPAKFDWSSSGLTNPLETPGIEKEILSDNSPYEVKNDQPTIIQRLMESQPATNKITPFSSMKPGVQKIISQLPALNFMKAKVFVFPINQA